jgi:hypothetical protein
MKKLFPMLLLCLMLWSTSALASTIIVTAGSNIGYDSNATFFRNVFEGEDVLSTGGTLLGAHTARVSDWASTLYTESGELSSPLLSAYDWVLLGGDNYLNDFERAAVVDYVLGGGNLWLVSDFIWSSSSMRNNYVNEVNNTLALLGSSIHAELDTVAAFGLSAALILPGEPLTAGMTSFTTYSPGILTGGTALARITREGSTNTVLAYETFGGSTTVPEPSTFALAALGLMGLVGLRRLRG